MKRKGFIILIVSSLLLCGCGTNVSNTTVQAGDEVKEEVQATPAPTETPTPEPTAQPTEEPKMEEAKEDQEVDKSPFWLWEYEGYVDEASDYLWAEEFVDRDFDGDGKNDRLYRKCDTENQLAFYTIEFGNDTKLEIPQCWNTGFPHIQSEDLDGDKELELLINMTYDTSTDPMMFGDIWLFDYDKKKEEYKEVKLPFDNGENGAKTIHVNYGKTVNSVMPIEIKKYDFAMDLDVDEDWLSNWWTYDEMESDLMIWNSLIKDYEDEKAIYCEIEVFGKTGRVIGFYLVYNDGEYEIQGMDYSDYSQMYD